MGAEHDRGRSHRTVVRVRAFALWWVLGLGLWLLLVDEATLPELIDGAVAATLAGGAAALSVGGSAPLRMPSGAAADCARAGWSLLAELPLLVRVLALALLRGERDPGAIRARPLPAQADPARTTGQRALAPVIGSVAPRTVVIAADDELLVHEFGAGGSS